MTETSYIKIDYFDCYHAAHPGGNARGGSSVILKQTMKNLVSKKKVIAVKVDTYNKNEYSISSIYCPPRYSLSKEDYSRLFRSLGSNFIIGGDINVKNTYWRSRFTTRKRKELPEAGRINNCEFHSGGKPTYWPGEELRVSLK